MGPLLAIESSCDETACAILGEDGAILANIVHSQIAAHAPFGGVVPEIASREHLEKIGEVVDAALHAANLRPRNLGAVAATYGPGLIGALLVGFGFAKGLALSLGVPFYAVHHIEGHLSVGFVAGGPQPPFLGLVASGGHSALYGVRGLSDIQLIGQTRDDAAGEAFDKTAKLLGLGYPGGKIIDELAEEGDAKRYRFPISFRRDKHFDFSFSGLKTAVRLTIEKERAEHGEVDGQILRDICAGLRYAIVKALLGKAFLACRTFGFDHMVLGGGVSANSLLRSQALLQGKASGIQVFLPEHALCTDNAVMIAACARAHLQAGQTSPLSMRADAGATFASCCE